jgi:hypothetical protein
MTKGFRAIIGFASTWILAGCTRKAQPSISIDNWWSFDYAKNACDMLRRGGEACPSIDPKSDVLAFEDQMRTAFSTDYACQGVTLRSKQSNQGDEPRWQLMFDYVPGERKQRWSLVSLSNRRTANGTGAPEEVAHAICSVAKGRGGNVE